MCVLVVDDHADSADSLAELLRLSMGCRVETAYTGDQAITAAETLCPDAVILDIRMPGLSGVEVAGQLKLAASGRAGPLLLAVTGQTNVADDLPAIDRHFDRAFAKPVNMTDLVDALAKHWQGQTPVSQTVRFEFSELFTRAAREVLPLALAKGQDFSFDYRGPELVLQGDEVAMHSGLYRVLCALVDLVDEAYVMFTAEVQVDGSGAPAIVVTAAAAGDLAADVRVLQLLSRMGLQAAAPRRSAGPQARLANGICPNTGGNIEFASLASEGMLFRLELHPVDAEVVVDNGDGRPDAGGAHAWIVNRLDKPADLLQRRLQRLGWRVQRMPNCDDAARRLQTSAHERRPALVVVTESDAATLAQALDLIEQLPASTQFVFAVVAGSPSLSEPTLNAACDVRLYPLGPAELVDFTHRAHAGGGASAPPTISPGSPSRQVVLVVDDNEVNRIVASGLVEALGYEAATACDGLDAIEHCKRSPPAIVLMDINMPVLGGFDATRRIRELQRLGRTAPFAIVAATADLDEEVAARCSEVGMDGWLAKPLRLSQLREELRRVAVPPRGVETAR